MTMSAASSPKVSPPDEWPGILHHATAEVFSMMAGMEIAADAAAPVQLTENAVSPTVTVTGAVGIAGALSAIMSVRCSTQCATNIASHMLGVSIDEATPHQRDAIGEICNMVAGNFKAKIGLEDKCMLSVPTVITGGNYQLHAASANRRIPIRFSCEGEVVFVALEVKGQVELS